MKKLFFSIFSLLLVSITFAQNQEASKDADKLIKIYNFDDEQSATMLEIQQRKFLNLAEISSLEESNKKMYRHKRKAIYQSTDASLRRMLNDDQMKIYKNNRIEWRKKRADKTAELKAQGKTLEEIEDALLDLEQ